MRKNLLIGLLSLLGLCFPQSAHGQFIGYTSPQTTHNTIANAVSCPGGGVTNTITVDNLGQSDHFVFYTTTGTPSIISVQILASDGTAATQVISDTATQPAGILTANGYYAVVKVFYSCTGNGGTITINYYGTSANALPPTGAQDQTAYQRLLTQNNTSGSLQAFIVTTPYGSSCGELDFNNTSSVTGTTVSITGGIVAGGGSVTILPAVTMGTSGITRIPIPCVPSPTLTLTITPGAAGNFAASVGFWKPGAQSAADPCQSNGTKKTSVPINITTATTTQLVAISGNTSIYVCGITMTIAPSGTAADTITFEYGIGASCGTGTTVLTGAFGAGDLTTTTGVTPISFADPGTTMQTPPGQAFCAVSAGTTVNIQGVLTEVQQ